MQGQSNNGLARSKVLWSIHGLNLLTSSLELSFGQVLERIGCFTQVLLGTQIGITQQTSRKCIAKGPFLARVEMRSVGQLRLFVTSKLGPSLDLEFHTSRQHDLNVVPPSIVTHNDIGIPFSQLCSEATQQHAFVRHLLELWHFGCNLLINVSRELGHGRSVLILQMNGTNQGQLFHESRRLIRGRIQKDLLVANGTDRDDFILVSGFIDNCLELQSHSDNWWGRTRRSCTFHHHVQSLELLGTIHLDFQTTPRNLTNAVGLRILDANPTGSHQVALEDKGFQSSGLGIQNLVYIFSSIVADIFLRCRILGIVDHLEIHGLFSWNFGIFKGIFAFHHLATPSSSRNLWDAGRLQDILHFPVNMLHANILSICILARQDKQVAQIALDHDATTNKLLWFALFLLGRHLSVQVNVPTDFLGIKPKNIQIAFILFLDNIRFQFLGSRRNSIGRFGRNLLCLCKGTGGKINRRSCSSGGTLVRLITSGIHGLLGLGRL
mmetsp:Transcript_35255/g.85473  ORF Transcript_35255/g.85473 Transcript_35255/m.85473 type:complete len:494 (+) Transcript_35255:5175-6656(+)